MDELGRFTRYEEDFLNSSRIITRTMRLLEVHKDNVGEIINFGTQYRTAYSELWLTFSPRFTCQTF